METEQKNIIETIRQVAKNLSPKKREQLIQILNDEENLIDNSDDYVHFKRKNFLNKVSVFCKNCSDKDFGFMSVLVSVCHGHTVKESRYNVTK